MSRTPDQERRYNRRMMIALIPWGLVLWAIVEVFYWIRAQGGGDVYKFLSMIPLCVGFFWFLTLNRFAHWIDRFLPGKK